MGWGQGVGGGEQRRGGLFEASRATAPLSAGPGLGGRDSGGGTELSSRWLPTQGPAPQAPTPSGSCQISLEARHTFRKDPPPTGAPCGQALGSLGFGVLSHPWWRGPGGGAGTGHLATLTWEEGSPWTRTRRPWRAATGALFLPPKPATKLQREHRSLKHTDSVGPSWPPLPVPSEPLHLLSGRPATCPARPVLTVHPQQPRCGAPPRVGAQHGGPTLPQPGSCLTKQAPHLQTGP